jgi:hypothetical protein
MSKRFILLKNNLYRKLFKNELRNTSNMLRYPAAERNKEPILNVLKQILSSDHKMRALEIGLSFKFRSNLSKSF